MQIAMQIAIIALMSTFVYALVALGFTLVFGILRVVNFAHGEFYMLGAYAMYVFYGQFGWPYLPSIAAAAVLVGFLGLLAERGLFRRFVGDEMGGMIMSLALAITLQAGISLLFARKDGEYLANLAVQIQGPKGEPMAFKATGPICLLKLPRGHYSVKATTQGGESQSQNVDVSHNGHTLDFRY